MRSLDLRSVNGRFDLSADVRAQVSGRVRGNGTSSYDPASGVLTIRINEVRFSILNVTGQVFDELKKQESDKLKVRRPFVYLSLK
jgi:hypothetical protein